MRHPARLAGASLLRLQSDTRLAELAVTGHVAAFDAIVDRYRTPLLRYCAGIVGPSRAEDAVQQALINAHDALQRTDEVRHLRSWLYRIAHNAALNVLRAVRDDVSLDDASPQLASGGGPAEAFETSERFRATVEALRELPERQRAALVLRELEGRSHEEIAEALGVTKGSARQHLMRARVALRGVVTAITPYPIVVRLADALAAPGGAGWTDAAVGAGTGATLAKLTAGVAATGALVGGAVGTHEVVDHQRGTPAASAETRGAAPTRTTRAAAASVHHTTAVVLPARAAPAAGTGAAPSSDRHRASSRHPTASRPHHHRRPEPAAPAVTPAPPPLTPPPATSDDRSPSSGPGPSGTDDSTTARHDSRQSGSSSSGKGSSGRGSGDSGSGGSSSSGSSGKGKSGGDAPATTIPPATLPAPTPAGGSGSSGSDSSGSGASGSGSGTSGSDSGASGSGTSNSGSSGSDSSGSGSSGAGDSGSGSSGDGTTTVADDD